MNTELIDRIRATALPSLPASAARVLALAENEHADLLEIAQAAAREPALCRRILLAAECGQPSPRDLTKALQACLFKLGLRAVRMLTIASALVDGFRAVEEEEWSVGQWRRSLYAATAARELAQHLRIVRPEEAFLGALAMDLGTLVLGRVVGTPYHMLLGRCVTHPQLLALEKQLLGLAHPLVGALVAPAWKIPADLVAAMRCQHPERRADCATPSQLAQLLEVAGRCADIFVDADPAPAHAEAQYLCRKQYGMDSRAVALTLEKVAGRASDVASLLGLPGLPYQVALERANGALAAATLLVQQKIELLKQNNSHLHSQAGTDSLTGLATRARFDEVLQRDCRVAAIERMPMSLLLIDVDRFKSVNDTHGHLTGDQVLRAIGATLSRARRRQDTAARYGGEELAVVLPGTSRLRATAIAEYVRRSIAATAITIPSGQNLKVTVSIGVATVEAVPDTFRAHDLLEAADRALYAAKEAGRNRISVLTLVPAEAPASARKCA